MNNVSLEGCLTKDPELKGTDEKPVCDMRLAVIPYPTIVSVRGRVTSGLG